MEILARLNMTSELLPTIAIGMMLIGILFSIFLPRQDPRHSRALAVFVLGSAILLAGWLMRNTLVLEELESKISLILLSVIFAFVQIVKRR